jgi:hypothetical protein
MAVEESELLTAQEFEAAIRHKGAPQVGINRFRFFAAVLLAFVGIVAVIGGIALIYWPAALVVGGLCLIGWAYLIDVSAPPKQEDQRG